MSMSVPGSSPGPLTILCDGSCTSAGIVRPHLHEGMVVAHLGCSMGYFTIAMAHMVGQAGSDIAIDFQQKMLNICCGRARCAGAYGQRRRPRMTLCAESLLILFWRTGWCMRKRTFPGSPIRSPQLLDRRGRCFTPRRGCMLPKRSSRKSWASRGVPVFRWVQHRRSDSAEWHSWSSPDN